MDKRNGTILIVDDEQNHRLMLKLHLEDKGFVTVEAENGYDAICYLEDNKPDIVILDVKMDVMDGLTTLARLRELGINLPVIMATAFSDVKTAVESMKLGAVDFLAKPVDLDVLIRIIDGIISGKCSTSCSEDKEIIQKISGTKYIFEGVYSESGLGKIINLLKMVAPTDATTLIIGESGTGKELIARSIHLNSPRKNAPFLAVNCAALNENIIESELFGHEKGSFTGASVQKKGKFELADSGTLFLDEIAELPLTTQAKLLRAIQEKTFERVGGEKSIKSDIRLVAATNKNLKSMVEAGDFRDDLFFRLNVFPIKLPPLRDRKEEIPFLIDYFINKYAKSFGKVVKGCSKGFLDKIIQYRFPGNIRELENLVERSIILTTGEYLEEYTLPQFETEDIEETSESLDMKDNEKHLILKALKETGGNKTKAADKLGISRRSLHYKLNDYNIEV